MLSKKISEQILTIGCEYQHPKGGVAQVMYNYKQYVFPRFKCIVNSGGKYRISKAFRAVSGLFKTGVKLLIDKKIKLVHIHTASYNSFRRSVYFVCLAKALGKKVVLHIHGGGFKEYYATNPQWISSILNRCDAIITLSESWKEYYQSITNGVDIYVVENIVSPPKKGKLLWKDDMCHLLFLGLITKEKGIFDLLEVLYDHIDEFRGKLMLHIGGNGKVSELGSRMQQYGLSDMVKYEGFVSGVKKTDLLFNCDAFILPSYTEGLPVAILEAMSYGKPILATPVGGIPEVVIQNENGILFQPRDKNGIYKALNQLMEDKNQRKNMGGKSFLFINSYLPNNVSEKLSRIYQNLLRPLTTNQITNV